MSPRMRKVLRVLMQHAELKIDFVFPVALITQKKIAEIAKIHQWQVNTCIDALKDRGLVFMRQPGAYELIGYTFPGESEYQKERIE